MDVESSGGSGVLNSVNASIEREQAKRFAAILRSELGDMRQVVAIAERKRSARQQLRGETGPPARIVLLLDRIEEADRILNTLTARFKLS